MAEIVLVRSAGYFCGSGRSLCVPLRLYPSEETQPPPYATHGAKKVSQTQERVCVCVLCVCVCVCVCMCVCVHVCMRAHVCA